MARPQRRRRLVWPFCTADSTAAVGDHRRRSSTSRAPPPPTPPLAATEVQLPSNTPVKGPLRGDSDLVAPYSTNSSPLHRGRQPSPEPPVAPKDQRRGSPAATYRYPANTSANAAAAGWPKSEAASAPRRLSRAAPPPRPLQPTPHPLLQPTTSSSVSPRTPASLSVKSVQSGDYAYPAARPPLRALPAPDSRLLVFNTHMTSPVPRLVHGGPQQHEHGYAAGLASAPEPHAAPPRLSIAPLPTVGIKAEDGSTSAGASTAPSVASPYSGTVLPGRRRSRLMAAIVSETPAAPPAFGRVPPAAPALHFSNFLVETSQNEANLTPRSAMAGSFARPASSTSLTASPSLWSSTNVPFDATASTAASSAAGSSNELVLLVPTHPYSGSESGASSTSNSLPSSSLVSSSSVTSLIDHGPGDGITSPVPLAEHGFAPWQNQNGTSAGATRPLVLGNGEGGDLPPPATSVGASILMPRRNSSHGSAETTMGSISFISARLRKGSREAEATREIETVADLVARMQATKRRTAGDSADLLTPDSGDLRAGLTQSSGGSREPASRGTSAGLDGSSRSGGLTPAMPVPPPPPPSRVSGESGRDGSAGRGQRRSGSTDGVTDTPLCAFSPELQPAQQRPYTPPSTSLNDRDTVSSGSGRSGSSYRRRDVKASVEAALANMGNSSAPSPSAASRRKRRDMAVNFLFAP